MYPALGNQWNMLYQLSDITWNAPRAVDSSCKATLLSGLEYEIGQLNPANAPVPGDFYYWGGTLAAVSRLALIAYVIPAFFLISFTPFSTLPSSIFLYSCFPCPFSHHTTEQ